MRVDNLKSRHSKSHVTFFSLMGTPWAAGGTPVVEGSYSEAEMARVIRLKIPGTGPVIETRFESPEAKQYASKAASADDLEGVTAMGHGPLSTADLSHLGAQVVVMLPLQMLLSCVRLCVAPQTPSESVPGYHPRWL